MWKQIILLLVNLLTFHASQEFFKCPSDHEAQIVIPSKSLVSIKHSSHDQLCTLNRMTHDQEVVRVGMSYDSNPWESVDSIFDELKYSCDTNSCEVKIPKTDSDDLFYLTSYINDVTIKTEMVRLSEQSAYSYGRTHQYPNILGDIKHIVPNKQNGILSWLQMKTFNVRTSLNTERERLIPSMTWESTVAQFLGMINKVDSSSILHKINSLPSGNLLRDQHFLQSGETASNETQYSRKKRGLIINGRIHQPSVEHFNKDASWFYNYMQTPYDWQGDWADANNIEFVPMISLPQLNHENGTIKCVFQRFSNSNLREDTDICTVQDTIDVLAMAKAERAEKGVEIKYLMGFNEMYNKPYAVGNPLEVAYYWRVYVQPAAIANGLDLVSPTVAGGTRTMKWFANFLKRCYDERNNTEFPCDIDLIKKFALHHYNCRESRWINWFGGDESRLMRGLTDELGEYGDKKDWGNYVRNREIWVTETNCYWEVLDHHRQGYPHLSTKEQCLRITGQKPETHGKGSLATMEEMDNIERYSWWTIWNEQIKPNYLTYFDGQLSPIGRAYMRPGDTSMNCTYNHGEQMEAGDAMRKGDVDISTCESTGTTMARIVDGRLTFDVNVSRDGDYAINLSYISPGEDGRFLQVSVNHDETATFSFTTTGLDCDNGGSSTVVSLELKGFKHGLNHIHFETDGDNHHLAPYIEWVSVVTPLS